MNRAYLGLFLGAVCISFSPILVRLLDMGPSMTGFYRVFIGGLVFLGLSFFRRQPAAPKLSKKLLLILLVAGLVFAGDLFVWHRSIKLVGAGLATIFGNTQIFYLGAFGILFLGESGGFRYWLSVLLGFGGIVLLIGFPSEVASAEDFGWGVFFGLTTGGFYAAYIGLLRWAESTGLRIPTTQKMAIVSLTSAAGLYLLSAMDGELRLPQGVEWLWVFCLGVFIQFLGWLLITKNLPKLPISRASLIILTQPVLASLMGAYLFKEYLTSPQILGAIMTLAGVYAGGLSRQK